MAPEKDNQSPITKLSYSPSPRMKSNLSKNIHEDESCSEMYSNSGFESTLQTPFSLGPFESSKGLRKAEEKPEETNEQKSLKTPNFGGGGKVKKSLLALNLDSRLEKKN